MLPLELQHEGIILADQLIQPQPHGFVIVNESSLNSQLRPTKTLALIHYIFGFRTSLLVALPAIPHIVNQRDEPQ